MRKIVKMSELIPSHFHDLWRKALDPNTLNIVAKGGRGSGKSSDIAHIIVQLIVRYPMNAVVIRKIDNTLNTSVFEQIKWAIQEQGLTDFFSVKVSPMEIKYNNRGNRIVFRGAQNPERLKSLKDSQFPFTIAWLEELGEFKTEDEVTTITNSLLRGELENGAFYKFFYSYNPPKRKGHWVNKKYEPTLQPDNTFVHYSTYLDNPFIAKEFHKEAEAAKERNEMRYRWEYLGEAIGAGVVPFDNLVIDKIPDDLFASFDNMKSGLDFGYATDPLSFVRWHYDKKKRTIYAVDEYYGVQISNRKAAEWLTKRGYSSDIIIADSSEPKSIDELKKEHGIKRVKGAKKGPDSVEYGERWLADLDAIVIDPYRTPNIAREFENIDFEVDKDGNPKPRLQDKDNHCLTGDTIVNTLEGDIAIKDLIGKTGQVYCYDVFRGIKTTSEFKDVRMTKQNVEVYELELSNGDVIKATENHLIFTDDGWKELKDITPNDKIISIDS